MNPGDEMMIWCEGGRSSIKRQIYPPALELIADGGAYVLHDDGEPTEWRYVFVAHGSL